MASVIELAGRYSAPETDKLVVDALAVMPLTITEEVTNKFVEVTLVKIPVEAVVAPIGVLFIVPLSIVRPLAIIGSVTESFGRYNTLETVKLVVEALTIEAFTATEEVTNEFVVVALIADKDVKLVVVEKITVPLEICMNEVPVTVVAVE